MTAAGRRDKPSPTPPYVATAAALRRRVPSRPAAPREGDQLVRDLADYDRAFGVDFTTAAVRLPTVSVGMSMAEDRHQDHPALRPSAQGAPHPRVRRPPGRPGPRRRLDSRRVSRGGALPGGRRPRSHPGPRPASDPPVSRPQSRWRTSTSITSPTLNRDMIAHLAHRRVPGQGVQRRAPRATRTARPTSPWHFVAQNGQISTRQEDESR